LEPLVPDPYSHASECAYSSKKEASDHERFGDGPRPSKTELLEHLPFPILEKVFFRYLLVQEKLPRQSTLFGGREDARFAGEIGKDEETEDRACCSTKVEDDAGVEEGLKDFGPGAAKDL
jgi:hypothetical protein